MVKSIEFDELDKIKQEKLIDLIKLSYLSDYISEINKSYKRGIKKITISELFPKISKFIISDDKFQLLFLHNPYNAFNYHVQIKLKEKTEKKLKNSLESLDLKEILNKLNID